MNFFFNVLKNKKITNNIIWLTSDRISRLSINFIVSIVVAKYLGPEQFGILSFALSFTVLFTFLSNLGLSQILVRELVSGKILEKKLLGTNMILRFTGSIISISFIGLILFYSNINQEYISPILILSLILVFNCSSVFDDFFQSASQNKFSSISKIITVLIIAVINLVLVRINANLNYFLFIYVIESIILMILLFYFYKRNGGKIFTWTFNFKVSKFLLTESWPLIILGAASLINARIDQIFIGNMVNNISLGNYAVASKISEAWLVVPAILSIVIAPDLIRMRESDYLGFRVYILRLIKRMFLFGIIFALLISLNSNLIISLIYSEKYSLAGNFLSLYIWTGLPYVSFFIINEIFYIEKITKYSLITSVVSIFLNCTLNYFLILKFESVGAIYASLIATYLTYFVSFCVVYKKTNIFNYNKKTINTNNFK